jgi:hypothetical protein
MDEDDLLSLLVSTRVWIYRVGEKFMIYEKLAEEGDDVKKKVADFYKEEDAVAYLEAHREMLKEYFKARFKFTVNYESKAKLPKPADVKKRVASNKPREPY